VRDALRVTVAASAYGKNDDLLATRDAINEQGIKLKEAFNRAASDIEVDIAADRDPGNMIIILAKEQRQYLIFYQWFRNAMEIISMAGVGGVRTDETLNTGKTPSFCSLPASDTESSAVQPPSVQSVAEMRTKRG
jgi:hypothetical protein